MNFPKKVYCRCFQTVFKLAIPLLPYRSPEILERVQQLPQLLKQQRIQRILVVTDGFLHRSGALDALVQTLSAGGIQWSIFVQNTPNPTTEDVAAAKRTYLHNSCQGLIGFGGGSSIDCAKAVGACIARPKATIAKLQGILKVIKPLPYLVAIPTTAGTGSETTVTTVITDSKTAHKFPISDFPLIPRAAVLDPHFTLTLPKSMTATTGMDALTHAIEAYIGRSTVKSTRADALLATKLVAQNLEIAYHNGSDLTARANMLKAAFHGGRAFSKSYVGYCHAVAHSLGGMYHTPHGLANAVLLPYTLEAYGSTIDKKAKDLAIAMGIAQEQTPADEARVRLIRHIRDMNARMGIPSKLTGIRPEDIPKMATFADREANPLYPVPVLMDKKQLERLYLAVMEETP